MKVLLLGGGGREHALAAALVRGGARIHAISKNRNPGILALAREHVAASDAAPELVVEKAKRWGIELAVVGPEAPLAEGVTDALAAAGIRVAAPSKSAARIETDKAWMRALLDKHRLAGQVRHRTCTTPQEVAAAVAELQPCVVKPAGLTGGKGVRVWGEHLRNAAEAIEYGTRELAAGPVVVEEMLDGEEFSLMAFSDGRHLAPMPLVQDHKRAYEGDKGPNTGGMGSYSDANHLLPFVAAADRDAALRILQGAVDALRADGSAFVGPIYGQFMLTRDGPKLVEVNARLGDPEAMNVLTLLDGNLLKILDGCAGGRVPAAEATFARKASVCAYVAPQGYGTDPRADRLITLDPAKVAAGGAVLYYAAVNPAPGGVRTTTSRSLGLVGLGPAIPDAHRILLEALSHIGGEYHVRRDIGSAPLVQQRLDHLRQVRA